MINIITGVGRCGSSFVAKFLNECGYKMGKLKWFEPMNAGYENPQTLDINNRLFRYFVKGEDINLWHVKGDIQELDFDAVKDTQFLRHPEIIKVWADVRDDIDVIWMHRDPKEIVASVKRNPSWNTPVYRCFEDLIEKQCKSFEKSLKECGVSYRQFMWPQILDTPELMIEYIEDLPEDAEAIWHGLKDI